MRILAPSATAGARPACDKRPTTRAATRARSGGLRAVFALLAAGAWLATAALAEEGATNDWEVLFNGKDLAGWVPVNDVTFAVTNGNLALVKGMGWLRTAKEYGDFVLELEWRALVPEYDSGIFIRCGAEGKPWPTDGWQVNLRYNALGALVRGYKTVVPAESPKLPVNQWSKLRLEVRGRQVTLDLDGERNWTFDALDRERGYLGIQAENRAFEFRNFRVRPLAPAKQ